MMQGILLVDDLEGQAEVQITYFLKRRITIEEMLALIICGEDTKILSLTL